MSGPTFWIVFLAGIVVGGLLVALGVAAHRDRAEHCNDQALQALRRIVNGIAREDWRRERVAMVARNALHEIEQQ